MDSGLSIPNALRPQTNMQRQLVESSNIISIGYDPQTRTLEVEFGKAGPTNPYNRIYIYRDVPPDIHESLMAHPSHGHYLNVNIAETFVYQKLGTRADIEPND